MYTRLAPSSLRDYAINSPFAREIPTLFHFPERIGEEVKWNGEEIWTNKFGGNRWKGSRVEKETDIGRIFER